MTVLPRNEHELSVNQMELIRKAIEYKEAALSKNTRRTYRSMWNKFCSWCKNQGSPFLPTKAETIMLYLSSIGNAVSFSSLDASIAAIEKAHKEAGCAIEGNPEMYRDVRKGIRKKHKEKLRIKQAPALSVVDLKVALKGLSTSIQDVRDKTIISVGYWAALRRSEIASIQYDNMTFTDEGVIIYLLGSKTSDKLEEIYLSKTKNP